MWEEAWREETGATREVLQGLIQLAAGCWKALAEKNPTGTVLLLTKGLELLGPHPDDALGLELGAFRAGMGDALARARRWKAGEATAPTQAEFPHLERAR